jgi:hypothetical protein
MNPALEQATLKPNDSQSSQTQILKTAGRLRRERWRRIFRISLFLLLVVLLLVVLAAGGVLGGHDRFARLGTGKVELHGAVHHAAQRKEREKGAREKTHDKDWQKRRWNML